VLYSNPNHFHASIFLEMFGIVLSLDVQKSAGTPNFSPLTLHTVGNLYLFVHLLGAVLTILVALTPLFLQTSPQFVHFGSSTGPKPAYYSKAWNPSVQQENG